MLYCKRFIFPLLLSAGTAFCAETRSDGLLFHHTFDNADMQADFSAGSGTPLPDSSGPREYTEGISGRAVVIGDDGKQMQNLKFQTRDNVSLPEGTLSFWIKPLDWNGDKDGFIFLAGLAEPSNQGFRIYKYAGKGGFLWFLSGRRNPVAKKTEIQNIISLIKSWKQGEWHQIVVSWRAGGQTFIGKESRQSIYVDGVLKQVKSLPDHVFPASLPTVFTIGPAERWGTPTVAKSAIDEFQIYNRELSPEEIRAHYYRFSKVEAEGKTIIGVPDIQKLPEVNADITDRKWENCFIHNTFFDHKSLMTSALNGTFYALGYTRDYLYIGIRESLNKRIPVSIARNRDGETYRDDSWEIYLSTTPDGNYRHYVVNANGSVYDGIGRDSRWNGNAKTAVRVTENALFLEIAIPAKDLGLERFEKGLALYFNLAKNLCGTNGGRKHFAITPTCGNFHNFKQYAELKLLDPSSAVKVSLNDVANDNTVRMELKMDKSACGTAELKCNGKKVAEKNISSADREITFPLKKETSVSRYLLNIVLKKDGHDILRRELVFNQEPGVVLSTEMNPENGETAFLMVPLTMEIGKQLENGHVELAFLKDGKVIKKYESNYCRRLVLSRKDLPDVSCDLQVSFTDSKKRPLFRIFSRYYHIDYETWANYEGGLDDQFVPTPWKPVTYRDGMLQCLDRMYDFRRRALPDALREKGMDILRSPVVLRMVTGGKNYDLADFKLIPGSQTPGRILMHGSGNIAGCRIQCELEFEFDGYCVLDFRIDRKNTEIEKLYLEFPFTKETSLLKFVPFLNEKAVQKEDVGCLKPQSWAFGPGIWIGNDERGLTWFAESDEFYRLKDSSKAVEINVNEKSEAALRVNLIDSASKDIPQALEYKFGFQVTPVKPFPQPRDWMNYSLVNAPNEKIFISGWGNRKEFNYQGMPGNDGCLNAEEYNRNNHETTKKLRSGNSQYRHPLLAVRYLYPNMCPSTVPELLAFRQYWTVQPDDVWNTDGPDTVPSVRVSPDSKSWANFYCWRFDRYFRNSVENGMYQDFSHPIKDMNPAHGAGYVRNGKRYPTYSIFKFHEIQKRLYKIAKKYESPEREIFFIGHSGGSFILPHGNFWQMTNDGEYLGGVVNPQKPYLDFFSEGRWRTEFNGRQFGLLCNFIPIEGKGEAYTNEMFALIVPGAVTWMHHSMINAKPQKRVFDAYREFGMSDIEKFLPYWNNQEYLNVNSGHLKASMLLKAGKILLLVGNWGNENLTGEFTLNLKKLALPENVMIKDCDSGQSLPLNSKGMFRAEIKAKNFKIFLISCTKR